MHWLLQYQRSLHLPACLIFDPSLLPPMLEDQYAFKPSGSTTAAVINFTDKLTKMLETNNYVRCLMIDFCKAFDNVDHVLLLKNWFS